MGRGGSPPRLLHPSAVGVFATEYRDPLSRQFIEAICNLRRRGTSDDYEEAVNTMLIRMGENRDDTAAAEDMAEVLPAPDVVSFQAMFEMAEEVIDNVFPDRALTIAINGMRAARGRWNKEKSATANMNALLMAHAITGLMLTGLGHPDFLTDAEKAQAEALYRQHDGAN